MLRVPYFLEPHYDEEKPSIESNRERLIKKWGGKEGWERQKLRHDLKGRGQEAGIPHFNLDRLTSNTMASHRLIQHVGKKYGLKVSETLYDRLNVYYFVDGHALNDKKRLAKVAHEEISRCIAMDHTSNSHHGIMTEEEIFLFLNSDEGRREIEHALEILEHLGIHGIPKFIIEGRRIVDGAAHSNTFVEIFRDIERKGCVHGGPIFGDVLGVSEGTIEKGSHSREDMSTAHA